MSSAIAGWLGLLVLAAAVSLTVALEVLDQQEPSAPGGRTAQVRRTSLRVLLALLVAASVAAVVVRFAVYVQ